MGRRNFKLTKLWLILLLSGIICVITACSDSASEAHSNLDMISDLKNWLGEEMGVDVSVSLWEPSETDDECDACFYVEFEAGDIGFKRTYALNYNYSRAFGWNLSEVISVKEDDWEIYSANPVDTDRVISDLEGYAYYSSYSNGQMEARRALSIEILSRESDAGIGYDRINLEVVLNADDVHEVVHVETEYLLDESYSWQLFAQDMYLDTVNVQSGVSDDILLDGLNSLKFYRDEEDSTWSIGELNRLTYNIISRELDSENSEEVIELNFRGEGAYMYITGTVNLDFRFSSGWYLYDISIDEDTCETGMLLDTWEINEDVLEEDILNDHPFTYDLSGDIALTEDMISDLEITEIRITENGKYQTAYFQYDAQVCESVFHIEGYGKYELSTDGVLSVNTWSDSVDDITFDLTGVWYACDLTEDYLAYHTLKLTDTGNGTLEGTLTVYGVDLTGDEEIYFSASCSVLGNITFGTEYELFVENWTTESEDSEILLPYGKYDLFTNQLTFDNAYSESCVFTTEEPTDRISRSILSSTAKKGEAGELLQDLLDENEDRVV